MVSRKMIYTCWGFHILTLVQMRQTLPPILIDLAWLPRCGIAAAFGAEGAAQAFWITPRRQTKYDQMIYAIEASWIYIVDLAWFSYFAGFVSIYIYICSLGCCFQVVSSVSKARKMLKCWGFFPGDLETTRNQAMRAARCARYVLPQLALHCTTAGERQSQ